MSKATKTKGREAAWGLGAPQAERPERGEGSPRVNNEDIVSRTPIP